ncbi:centriole and centriolar satellite protein OFD1 isoform X2 [Sorex araneus]|uniref:centriole and centriolar satellite protein OFD1 isoform X2 n=1 Tax=Sorex araneus TaxID=42254 RepID=UPI002433F5A0|nr:centriole and centriolar satellite protein OFD1 isoform X2 [Sorex araneus]
MTESLCEPTARPSPSLVSQDELRKKLYRTFKERGVLDTLKTQLRQQMIQELMQPVLCGDVHPQPMPVEGSTLSVEASNILVADHLQRCGYEYSLSVFYPESGLSREKMFTMEDLLQLIQISPQSSIYKTLISRFDKENKKGFLMEFLKELAEYHQPKVICDVETQTSSLPNRDSLAEKLQLIDDQFAEACIPRPKLESLELKLNEYKRELEEQLRAEMCEKLKYLKENEIAKIKMEERRKSEKEIAEFRKEFEIACQVKSEALLSQERESIERIQKQKEMETKEIFAERQILLKDMNLLREREEQLKQKMDAFDLAQKAKEEEDRAIKESLRKREEDIKNIEETYEEKLKNEILKCQLELKDSYITTSSKLMEDEKKNKEKTVHLEEEISALKSKLEAFTHSENHAKELELELESAKVQVLALTEQNQKLNEKVKEKNAVLKEENLALQAQNRLLQQRLEESRNENFRLRNRQPRSSSAEMVVFEQEHPNPEGFSSSLPSRGNFETHRQALHKQLQTEIEHSAQLKAQLLDYDSSVKRLTAQVSTLKMQLRQTQTALENEMYHNPKPSGPECSSSAGEFLAGNILPPGSEASGDLPGLPQDQERLEEGAAKTERGDQDPTSPDSDLEFVASTKARVKELEEEAEQLEKTFQDYNLRASQQQPHSLMDEVQLLPLQFMRSSRSFTPRSRRRYFLAESGVGSEALLGGLPDGEKNELAEGATGGRASRRRGIASRRLSSMAKRSLEDELGLDGDGQSCVNSADPCLNNMLQPLSAEAKCGSPSHSRHSTLDPNASLYQRPDDVEDSEFPNLDDVDFMDKEEFETYEYGGNFPRPFDLDAFYPAGDMPHIDTTSIAIHPAGDMLYMDSASAPATIPLPYPDPEQKRIEDRRAEEQLWEQQMKERRLREEKRHSERQEALEKERKELERLEQERKLIEQTLNLDIEKDDEPNVEETKESACDVNPLEKYMKIIQQDKQKEAEDKSEKKKTKEGSGVDTSVSSDKEGSFAGFSQEDVDDFW